MKKGRKPKKELLLNTPVPVAAGPICPQITVNLDHEKLSKIALTGIYWASCETFIGAALAAIYMQRDDKTNDLVWQLDVGARQRLLKERIVEHALKDRLMPYFQEYEYAVQNYKLSRNIYAHGYFATTAEGDAFITPRNQVLRATEIDKAWEQSKYALFFAHWLTQIIHNHPGPSSWPQRPD